MNQVQIKSQSLGDNFCKNGVEKKNSPASAEVQSWYDWGFRGEQIMKTIPEQEFDLNLEKQLKDVKITELMTVGYSYDKNTCFFMLIFPWMGELE